MDKLLNALAGLVQIISLRGSLMTFAFLLSMIFVYTTYENRQIIYDELTVKTTDQFHISPPKDDGVKMVRDLVAKYPSILLVSLMDVDPVANIRRVVWRWHPVPEGVNFVTTETIESITKKAHYPLFNRDPTNNTQVLAIMNGEFSCGPFGEGIIAADDDLEGRAVYVCRVPLPPAFGKATGWFTFYLKKWPEDRIEDLKFDALNLSLAYFNAELAPRGQPILKK